MPEKQEEPSLDTVAGLLHPASTSPALLTIDGASIGHDRLATDVGRLAGRLRAAGIGPSDRVAIVLGNGPEMVIALLAVLSAGCAAPLNPRYREDEFRFYLDDLGAAAIISVEGATPALRSAVPAGVIPFYLRGEGLTVDLDVQGSKRPPVPADRRPAGDDVALVLHTSGTTSRPKIVPLRQRHLAASARNIVAHLQLTPADRSLEVMPLFHIHGIMTGLLAPLCAEGSVVCTPGFDAFKFQRWLEELSPTYYSAVPTMHQLVLARVRKKPAGPLRFVRSSSAALPGPVQAGLEALFEVPVLEAYGMTEATHQMTCNPLPPGSRKPGSVGLPTGIEVAVLDRDGQVLPAGGRGEVAIRGATVMDGYENNPEANASAFSAAGWFRTGDEGMLDADGYLFLTGRLKEQINRGGEKISPLEIEDVLLGNPAIAEAVAFALPHDKLGEEVGVAVVLAEGEGVTEAALRAYLGERLAAFKVPRRIVVLPEIPKGATGKLQRVGLATKLGLSRSSSPT